jgi:hypothetical protein
MRRSVVYGLLPRRTRACGYAPAWRAGLTDEAREQAPAKLAKAGFGQ